jgi:acyl-CoA synthetase (AMP-forming)/AMP-acid ligase II
MQRNPDSIVDILAARAIATPDSLAYGFLSSGEHEEARLTWQELDRRSRAIAAAIAERVEPGARVLLLFPPGLDFIAAFFGCAAARAIALPAYPPSTHRRDHTIARLRGMIADAGVSLVVAAQSVRARRAVLEDAVPELLNLDWMTTEEIAPDGGARDVRLERPRRTDVALLQYTSGSTSSPRGVVVTHANLLHNLAHGERLGDCDARSVGVSWLPVNHDMGLIGAVLQPAFSGFPMWLMAPAAFLQRPMRWLQAISRFGATHSAAPNFAYDLCARRVSALDRRSLDLSTWRVAYNAAEPVRASTLAAFQRAFGECGFHWEAFRPAYGLAESTLLVTGSRDSATAGPTILDVDRRHAGHGQIAMTTEHEPMTVVSCGHVVDDVQIVVVDPVRRVRCAPDEIGEIWITSQSVARGYWNRPEETAATFGARLATGGTADGPFLRTGDLGFTREGQLFVTGRLKDVLIVRGHNHYPQDLELTAEEATAAVRPGCCAAVAIETVGGDERVAIVAEVDARAERAHDNASTIEAQQAIADIRRAIHDVHGIPLAGVVLVPAGSLPRTTSGKLQRFLCRNAFAAGDLDALCHWIAPGMPSPVALRRAS